MPWLLDGNNLAGGRERGMVRQAALDLARRERLKVLLFFDGAPPAGTAPVERLGAVEVRYVGSADEAILECLRGGGRGWRLASDDRSLVQRARAAGAEAVASSAFWARVVGSGAAGTAGRSEGADPGRDVRCLGNVERLPEAPRRIPRRRRP